MTDPIDLSNEFIRLSALESGLSLALDPIRPVASCEGSADPQAQPASHSNRSCSMRFPSLLAMCSSPAAGTPRHCSPSRPMWPAARDCRIRCRLPPSIPPHPEPTRHAWQAMALDHLRIQERIVLSFDGEQTLLSQVARSALERHGLVWPEAVQLHGAIYERLDRGCMVSGEGGDQVLGSSANHPGPNCVAAQANTEVTSRRPACSVARCIDRPQPPNSGQSSGAFPVANPSGRRRTHRRDLP